MTSKYQERARIYHEAIKRLILEDWDPIGINGIEEAQDEYDSYVKTIYNMVITRKSESEIFDYLWWLETEHMGLSGNRQATQQVASKLLHLPAQLDGV